jgi:hypothetical protein
MPNLIPCFYIKKQATKNQILTIEYEVFFLPDGVKPFQNGKLFCQKGRLGKPRG